MTFKIMLVLQEFDTLGAIVATVESSSISACSAGSMVSMGKFQKLCLRFAEDFNHTLDDWKPDPTDPNIMNLCLVSEVYLIQSLSLLETAPPILTANFDADLFFQVKA
jgi:hypothetical protein